MYTKCPECNAVFRVTSEQLSIAEGLVRCGICDVVFNGHEHIQEDEPDANSENQLEEHIYSTHDDQEIESVSWVDDKLEERNNDENTLIDADIIPTVIKDDFGSNLRTRNNSPIQIAVFTLGAIALALFFLGQISYWQNVDLLPRSWINSFCNPLGCGDQNKPDLAAIKILNRNIYSHPNAEDALMITTSFVNQAASSQPFPVLEISLLDTQGQLVAIRRFSPKDYLVDKSLNDTLMLPNQPVGARLEVQDPGNTVIAYEFEFY